MLMSFPGMNAIYFISHAKDCKTIEDIDKIYFYSWIKIILTFFLYLATIILYFVCIIVGNMPFALFFLNLGIIFLFINFLYDNKMKNNI